MVYAWRVSVVKNADGELASVIEAMDADYGRTPDGEVVAYFKQVESPEAVNRIAPAIAKAAPRAVLLAAQAAIVDVAAT